MFATVAWVLVLLYFCSGAVTSTNVCRSSSSSSSSSSSNSSSSSSSYYKPPQCGDNCFYCPGCLPTCLPRSQRCTGNAHSNLCIQKTYLHCNYDKKTEKFQVWRHSTNLQIFGRRRRGLKLEHQFIVYRGLMYEFGNYGFREQDPNDPYYEYGSGRRASFNPKNLGLSSCTYEKVRMFVKTWTADQYRFLRNNCQHFAKGLGAYLIDNCSRCPSGQQDNQTNEDFARYIFSIAGTNCTPSTSVGSSGSRSSGNQSSGSQSIVPMPLVIFIAVGMLGFTLCLV